MSYPQNSWAILPATQCLLGKTKATLEECMLEMGRYGGTCTILICERNYENGKPTLVFLSSAGAMNYAKGYQHKAHHDQTLRNLGYHRVLHVIHYSVDRLALVVDAEGNLLPGNVTFDMKAPLFVFK
jgi:hypothetical protein